LLIGRYLVITGLIGCLSVPGNWAASGLTSFQVREVLFGRCGFSSALAGDFFFVLPQYAGHQAAGTYIGDYDRPMENNRAIV